MDHSQFSRVFGVRTKFFRVILTFVVLFMIMYLLEGYDICFQMWNVKESIKMNDKDIPNYYMYVRPPLIAVESLCICTFSTADRSHPIMRTLSFLHDTEFSLNPGRFDMPSRAHLRAPPCRPPRCKKIDAHDSRWPFGFLKPAKICSNGGNRHSTKMTFELKIVKNLRANLDQPEGDERVRSNVTISERFFLCNKRKVKTTKKCFFTSLSQAGRGERPPVRGREDLKQVHHCIKPFSLQEISLRTREKYVFYFAFFFSCFASFFSSSSASSSSSTHHSRHNMLQIKYA